MRGKIDKNVERKFEQLREGIESFFSEIEARMKNSGTTRSEAYSELRYKFGLNGVHFTSGSSAPIADLGSIDYLERLLTKPNYHSSVNSQIDKKRVSGIDNYAFRQSCYANYLGLRKEVIKFFELVSQINPALTYRPNSTKLSKKVKVWKKTIN